MPKIVKLFWGFSLFLIFLLVAGGAIAQDSPTAVTDDNVNAIAKKMYCPVCENIPLDTCGTQACADWRAEIRLMLEDGWTEQEIRNDFIARFGERVVGTPQDPVLWFLSVMVPFILIAIGLYYGSRFMSNMKKGRPVADAGTSSQSDSYYDVLEKDISG